MARDSRPKTHDRFPDMRQCEDCKIILEDDVRYCPNCGKKLDASAVVAPTSELAVLLTSANLHRVRQEWDAAIDDATAALELEPNNADVASLLANIYEQRGNLDEAAIWYKIAVELDPSNAANRARLQRVNLSVPRPPSPRRRVSLAVLVAMGTVVLVVVAVALTLALRGSRATTPRQYAGQHRTANRRPEQMRTTSTASTQSAGRAAIEGGTTSHDAGAESGIANRTPAEAAIKTKAGDSDDVRAAGAQVDDAVADPRQGVVVVTFSVSTKTPVNRARVLSAAGAIARNVFAANREVKFVTARCVVTPGGPATTQIAFVGDVARTAMDSLAEKPTEAQLDGAFATKWWNPQIER